MNSVKQSVANPRSKQEIELLRAWISYDPKTGVLSWRKKPCIQVSVGDSAGALHDGYIRIRCRGEQYMAHRVAWALHTGAWPAGEIDHINGVRHDNRISNLRDVPRALNRQNVLRARADNRVGIPGVKKTRSGAFEARIVISGRYLHLGTFDTPATAHEAYVSAKRRHHKGNTL